MAAPKVCDGLEMATMGQGKLARLSTGEAEAWPESSRGDSSDLPDHLRDGHTANDRRDMQRMGKKQEFRVGICWPSV